MPAPREGAWIFGNTLYTNPEAKAMVKTRRSKKSGLPPGTLVHIGEEKTDHVRITLIRYNETELHEEEIEGLEHLEELSPERTEGWVAWINMEGVHDPETIEKVGKSFAIHPLTLEDIVNTEQRPKVEEYEDYLFVVLKTFDATEHPDGPAFDQMSLVLKPNMLISFEERSDEICSIVRNRIRSGKGRLRKAGSDYLAYCLIDAVVDHYFNILEKFGEEIELLQEELITNPGKKTLQQIHQMKRQMILFRRSVWPLREAVGSLLRGESAVIEKGTLVYLRDVYDHVIHVIDSIEIYREMLGGMIDIYLSSISNRMNEIMKVLTVIATIFMPLTFIAGVYGMNFKNMPELDWPWGYPAVLLLMAAVAVYMLFYFRRKKWI
jgi:magnesium transporter